MHVTFWSQFFASLHFHNTIKINNAQRNEDTVKYPIKIGRQASRPQFGAAYSTRLDTHAFPCWCVYAEKPARCRFRAFGEMKKRTESARAEIENKSPLNACTTRILIESAFDDVLEINEILDKWDFRWLLGLRLSGMSKYRWKVGTPSWTHNRQKVLVNFWYFVWWSKFIPNLFLSSTSHFITLLVVEFFIIYQFI